MDAAESNDQDVGHTLPAGLLAGTTGGTDPQTGRAGGGTNTNAFKPMLPAPKIYSTPSVNSTNFRVVRNTMLLCYAFGAADPTSIPPGQQKGFPTTPGNVEPDNAGPWFAWVQGDMLSGVIASLRETIIRNAPMFSSKQYRLWSLQLNAANAQESGFARWGILTNLGTIHKTLSEAKEKQTPGINWGKMRVGNFKMIVLPFQNQSTLSTKKDQNIPNQAPPPRLHMAVKYVTTNKYSIHSERGEQGNSLVQKEEDYAEHWKKAVLTPLMSESASIIIDARDGTTVIPIDIEYQKTFSVAAQATQYPEWKRAAWTPWFETEDNVKVRTAAIETQVMAYMETIGPTLGYFKISEDGTVVEVTQQNISAGGAPTEDWKRGYINSVLAWLIRLEYKVQYMERREDQLAWA